MLRPGQDTVLSWSSGALDCRVVAAAGAFVLLRPERANAMTSGVPTGSCALTFLDGLVPMGWDGSVEPGSAPGELRFRVAGDGVEADRRSSVRLPVFLDAAVTVDGVTAVCQLLDVSAGGARFRSARRLTVGTPAHLHASLGDGLELDADAVVRTSEPSIAAVEFTQLNGISAQEIGAWTVARLRASLNGQG